MAIRPSILNSCHWVQFKTESKYGIHSINYHFNGLHFNIILMVIFSVHICCTTARVINITTWFRRFINQSEHQMIMQRYTGAHEWWLAVKILDTFVGDLSGKQNYKKMFFLLNQNVGIIIFFNQTICFLSLSELQAKILVLPLSHSALNNWPFTLEHISGLADPLAVRIALSALDAVQLVGMPESDCIIAQAAVYLARAPKSREVMEKLLFIRYFTLITDLFERWSMWIWLKNQKIRLKTI